MSLYHRYKDLDEEGKQWLSNGVLNSIMGPLRCEVDCILKAMAFVLRKEMVNGELPGRMTTGDESLAIASLSYAFDQDWKNLRDNTPLRNLIAEQNLT